MLTSCGDEVILRRAALILFCSERALLVSPSWVVCLYLIRLSLHVFQNLVPGERTSLQQSNLVLSPQLPTHEPPVKPAAGSKQTASVTTSPSLSWLSNITSGNVNKENKGMYGTGEKQTLLWLYVRKTCPGPSSIFENDTVCLLEWSSVTVLQSICILHIHIHTYIHIYVCTYVSISCFGFYSKDVCCGSVYSLLYFFECFSSSLQRNSSCPFPRMKTKLFRHSLA